MAFGIYCDNQECMSMGGKRKRRVFHGDAALGVLNNIMPAAESMTESHEHEMQEVLDGGIEAEEMIDIPTCVLIAPTVDTQGEPVPDPGNSSRSKPKKAEEVEPVPDPGNSSRSNPES